MKFKDGQLLSQVQSLFWTTYCVHLYQTEQAVLGGGTEAKLSSL